MHIYHLCLSSLLFIVIKIDPVRALNILPKICQRWYGGTGGRGTRQEWTDYTPHLIKFMLDTCLTWQHCINRVKRFDTFHACDWSDILDTEHPIGWIGIVFHSSNTFPGKAATRQDHKSVNCKWWWCQIVILIIKFITNDNLFHDCLNNSRFRHSYANFKSNLSPSCVGHLH